MAPQLREEWDTIKDVFSGSFTFVSSKVKESDELLIRLLKIEIGVGLGHIRLYINKMLFVGVSWVIDKMDLIGFINKMF